MIVQESVNGGGYLQLATLSPTATSYSSLYLTANTTYSFRIVAYNDAYSGFSNIASATTNPAPAAPGSLSATAVSSMQINLAWTNNDTSGTVTSVLVEESIAGAGYIEIASVSPSTSSYSVHYLSASTSYSYRIVAYNDAYSAFSNIATPPPVPLPPPRRRPPPADSRPRRFHRRRSP